MALLAAAGVLAGSAPATAQQDMTPQHQAWSSTNGGDAVGTTADDLVASAYVGTTAATTYVAVSTEAGNNATVVLRMRMPETLAAFEAVAELTACPLRSELTSDGAIEPADAPEVDCEKPVLITPTTTGEVLVSLAELSDTTGQAETGFALVVRPQAAAGSARLVFDATQTVVLIGQGPATPQDPPTSAPPTTPGDRTSEPGDDALPTGLDLGAGAVPFPDTAPVSAQPAPAVAQPPVVELTPTQRTTVPTAATLGPEHSSVVPRALLGYLLLVALLVAYVRPRRAGQPGTADHARSPLPRLPTGAVTAALGLLVVPMLLSESAVYSVGLLLIAVVAAAGLHILVNWTGELSLAHAAFIGLPAFVAAQTAQSVGPILAVPVAVVAGVGLGAVLGIPALRARGLYVALGSLAVGAAINSYLFTKTWLVGPAGGVDVPVPSLLGIEFDSSRELYPLLALLVLVAIASVTALYRSSLARSLMWVRDDPSAAAAYGIAPNKHRAIGYCLAGAYAGLAGGLTVLWVQRLTAGTFPLSLSFLYLLLVVLAGRGPLLGVGLAVLLLQGAQLFVTGADEVVPYLGPLLLLLILTRFPAGLNGLVEVVMNRFNSATEPSRRNGVAPGTVLGAALVGLGILAVILGWYEAGSTNQLWIQNQYLISGGAGGLLLVILGIAIVIGTRVQRNHAAVLAVLQELATREHARQAVPVGEPSEPEAAPLPDQRDDSRARARSRVGAAR